MQGFPGQGRVVAGGLASASKLTNSTHEPHCTEMHTTTGHFVPAAPCSIEMVAAYYSNYTAGVIRYIRYGGIGCDIQY